VNAHSTWTRLRDHLINTGAMTPNGTTRRAQPRLCHTCDAHVITGLDDNIAALAVIADPTPLDQLGELTALTQGRRTFTLETDGPRLVLNYRDAGRIQHRPPCGHRYDVLPSHTCGRPLPVIEANTGALAVALPPAGSPAPF
jgi:hypothetical protein